jgi:chloramphenicol-sensitive protein RarD
MFPPGPPQATDSSEERIHLAVTTRRPIRTGSGRSLDAGAAGWFYGVAAYTIWGLSPAYFGILRFASPFEIMAHRIIWTLVLMAAVLAVSGRLGALRGHGRRTWLLLAGASLAISVNWGTYIVAVLSGHVAETALGYFINPLVTVLIGLVVFGERLSRLAWCAVALAVVAVAVITVAYGRPPVIALTLAGSFAVYGAIKKVVPVDPRTSLSAETLLVAPIALGYLVFFYTVHEHHQIALTTAQFALLIALGLLTAAPLLFFGAAAKRLPVVTMGLLQYIVPILQLLWAVLVVHEQLSVTTWVGFGLVWTALLVFSADAIRNTRQAPRGAQERTISA